MVRVNDIDEPGGDSPRLLPKDYPPFLDIPCLEHVDEGGQAAAVYRTTKDGRTALLVYSALDRLHACQGEDQPWFGCRLPACSCSTTCVPSTSSTPTSTSPRSDGRASRRGSRGEHR